ncbi:hypothetical protein E5676_scaffold195G00150 [Cucumis melo var. makuwa]|uniref:Uncharacterized protein n=1 Tax=Cucumis melo var. makuwa TaxID=1194695 RepID=A0A5D3DG71_CUCMM|nr:hypothetical protein E6C27_scaffold34G001460 [Cucumis melo var. makuwa]TYK22596.1 hypothetical protein E5676_scaffold195G00150 [Cucumis melo var. makuwa]
MSSMEECHESRSICNRFGFTMVTRSRSRSSDIWIESHMESSTPLRPLANLIRPSGGVV